MKTATITYTDHRTLPRAISVRCKDGLDVDKEKDDTDLSVLRADELGWPGCSWRLVAERFALRTG